MTQPSTKLPVLFAFGAALGCSSDASSGASQSADAMGARPANVTEAPATNVASSNPASNAGPPLMSAGSAPDAPPVISMESPLQPSQLAPAGANGSSGDPGDGANGDGDGANDGDANGDGDDADPAPASPPSSETCNQPGAASALTPTIWVIGDSTASVYAANLYPRMGWAQPLQDFFAPACATIQDRAISGRSSKSFFDEGAWTPVRDALRAGDFVLIQFGHNDEKSEDPLRFTEPFTTFQQYLSIYIDEALAHGATPILLTPINRNDWQGAALEDTHGQYPVSMRQLAQTRQVALVDATALTETYFERIGEAATTLLFMDLAAGQFPNYPDGNDDNTHLQEGGARTIAQIILADLTRQQLGIAQLTKLVATAP